MRDAEFFIYSPMSVVTGNLQPQKFVIAKAGGASCVTLRPSAATPMFYLRMLNTFAWNTQEQLRLTHYYVVPVARSDPSLSLSSSSLFLVPPLNINFRLCMNKISNGKTELLSTQLYNCKILSLLQKFLGISDLLYSLEYNFIYILSISPIR